MVPFAKPQRYGRLYKLEKGIDSDNPLYNSFLDVQKGIKRDQGPGATEHCDEEDREPSGNVPKNTVYFAQ